MEFAGERVAGLEVRKASVTACLRVPAEAGERHEHVQMFAGNVPSLLALSDWLDAHGVTHVAIETTCAYWMLAWAILEDHFACTLIDARDVKQIPGRKPDMTEAQWLCRLAEARLLRASPVAPKPIRRLRNLIRYREAQIQDRQREVGRLHEILEESGLKLQHVASDLLGRSGGSALGALIDGTTDPDVLLELAQGRLRAEVPALREALQDKLDPGNAIVVDRILAHVDYLDEAIAGLSDAVEEQLVPLAVAVEALRSVPAFNGESPG